jgi:hypothetical protein
VVLRNDISLTPGAYDPTRLGDHDPTGPSRVRSSAEMIPQPGAALSPARGRASGRDPVGRDRAMDLRLIGT